jgi:hypothetical protein
MRLRVDRGMMSVSCVVRDVRRGGDEEYVLEFMREQLEGVMCRTKHSYRVLVRK